MKKKKKVFVAMSGGVDSSVAAALLKKRGFEVVGIFMKNWSENLYLKKDGFAVKSYYCPWQEDQEDMRRVCQKLDLPFYTFDFEKDYREKVINYFFESYEKGLTPNPDIKCNKEIKFKLFLEKSLSLGANFIATGHYARKITKKLKNGKEVYYLLKGKDKIKDQSYFLYPLNQKQLRYVILPIGFYQKNMVRKMAKNFGLATHDKKDSQGICFIGEVDLELFLKQRIKEKQGKIITTDGKVIGQHHGLPFFTIGQRKGINIGGGLPYYVAAKNLKTNTLIVTQGKENPNLYRQELYAKNVHWVIKEPSFPFKGKAKIRYRQKDQSIIMTKVKKEYKVTFKKPQRAITPGQSIVFYEHENVLGGGLIQPYAF